MSKRPRIHRWHPAAAAALWLHAASAHAVMVDASGAGQVLIYPYFTVRDGSQTLLSVVNGDHTGKAVKVHVREARNGRSVLSFNLYLAEFDVWTAALFTAADGTPALLTRDNSCTVPAINTNALLPQLPDGSRYRPLSAGGYSGERADGGPQGVDRAATGYIEMIEMGALVENSDSDRFATHVNGVPFSCASLQAAWATGGYWQAQPGEDVLTPRGKLSGNVSILQVTEGEMYTVNATALSRFSVAVQHSAPEAQLPDLSSAVTEVARQRVESVVAIDGRIFRSWWPQERAIDAVSAALSQARLRAEFSLETAIEARTSWLLTFPTRRHYTDPALVATAIPPFTVRRGAEAVGERFSVSIYNREGARPVGNIEFPTGPPTFAPTLCAATQRMQFVDALVSPYDPVNACVEDVFSVRFNGGRFEAGFQELYFAGNGHRSRPALDGEQWEGLPVIGFTTLRYRNNAARPGEIGIYSSARPQAGTPECYRAPTGACTPL